MLDHAIFERDFAVQRRSQSKRNRAFNLCGDGERINSQAAINCRHHAMHFDLATLYRQHGLEIGERELPDFLPLFLEFLSEIPESDAREHLASPLHVLEAIRQRLKKRKSVYSSVFSAVAALAKSAPGEDAVAELLAEPDPDPEDFEALDKAWEDEPVVFGPGAASADGCTPGSSLAAKMRAATRLRPAAPR